MNYSGNDTKFQIGLEDTYGELAAMQYSLEVTQFNVNVEPSFIESKALIGKAMIHSASPGMSLVKGSFTFEANPENIGLILGLMAGTEAAPALASGASGAYDHVFTPIVGGSSLKSFSIICDKKADVFGFLGCKIDKVKFDVTPDGYLLVTVDIIGQQEIIAGVSIDADITYSTLAPFKFTGLSALFGTAGSVAAVDMGSYVKKFSPEYSNNLEQDRFRANGSAYTSEIDYQKREVTVSVECDYTTQTDAYRASNFKTGTALSLRALFTHESEIETGYNYRLVIDVLYGIITAAPVDVPGSERLAITFTVKATDGANGNVLFTLRDASDDGYTTGAYDIIADSDMTMTSGTTVSQS